MVAIGYAAWRSLTNRNPSVGSRSSVRVSGLGIFNVAARPARQGRNPQTSEAIQIAASKAVQFRAGKAVKDALNPPTQKGAPRKRTALPKKSAVRK